MPFFGDMYISFGASDTSIASLFLIAILLKIFLKHLLSAVLLPIKSPVASATFCIAFFKAVFIASVANIFARGF